MTTENKTAQTLLVEAFELNDVQFPVSDIVRAISGLWRQSIKDI